MVKQNNVWESSVAKLNSWKQRSPYDDSAEIRMEAVIARAEGNPATFIRRVAFLATMMDMDEQHRYAYQPRQIEQAAQLSTKYMQMLLPAPKTVEGEQL